MYVQRYIPHLPAAGEVVVFDRSWYNRAGVERVMGFCTEEQAKAFLGVAPGVEKAIVDSGVILLKYGLEVSATEQTRRLQSRIDDPRKVWKLSEMDLKSYGHWDDYARCRDDMFAATDSAVGAVVRRAHRRQAARTPQPHHPPARQVPYEPLEPRQITVPERGDVGQRRSRGRRAAHPHAVSDRSRARAATVPDHPAADEAHPGIWPHIRPGRSGAPVDAAVHAGLPSAPSGAHSQDQRRLSMSDASLPSLLLRRCRHRWDRELGRSPRPRGTRPDGPTWNTAWTPRSWWSSPRRS